MLTAAAVYVLALKDRRLSGFRLVLVGIAISALMLSLNDYLLSRARIEDAQEATRWLLGSLNGRTWEDATPLLIGCALLLPASLFVGPRAADARARGRQRRTGSGCASSARGSGSSRSPSPSWR